MGFLPVAKPSEAGAQPFQGTHPLSMSLPCIEVRGRLCSGSTRHQWGVLTVKKVRVGLVGCGFVAELHMYAYRRVYGVEVEVAAVAARGDHVVEFSKRHTIAKTCRS